MKYSSLQIAYPSNKDDVIDGKLTPRECRESCVSYTGNMVTHVSVELSHFKIKKNDDSFNLNEVMSATNSDVMNLSVKLGDMPIMVMSEKCHLRGKNGEELVALKEEATELGGYFIMNGIERVIRLLQVPRRNHTLAIERNSYKNRYISFKMILLINLEVHHIQTRE